MSHGSVVVLSSVQKVSPPHQAFAARSAAAASPFIKRYAVRQADIFVLRSALDKAGTVSRR